MPRPPESTHDAFVRLTLEGIAQDTFVRLVLSSPRGTATPARRISARLVSIRGTLHLSVTTQEERRDLTRNLELAEVEAWLRDQIEPEHGFSSALLGTSGKDWQLSAKSGQPAKLTGHKPARTQTPDRSHDLVKQRAVDVSGNDWLHALGLTDVAGKPLPSQSDKFQQIQRYTEILGHQIRECGWTADAAISVVDMGCGRGALTFAVWHLLRRRLGLNATVIGIELRPELATQAQSVAHQLGLEGLRFMPGRIDEASLDRVDALIALHACDTATDDAIVRGIRAGARLIVVAPCCHQSVRPQLTSPDLLAPVLRHGLLEERFAEWLTDGLRALVLEWAGYRVRLTEFVSSEQTPKNLLLTAVRVAEPFTNSALREQIRSLAAGFGIRETPWMPLMKSQSP
ncbi:MAG: SAM-dependent methyltransferase [Verrucomicrobiales bacterium]|nr:SAM-dependent methyltransferase [Verrucomicrobiales bacterium]